MKRAWFWLRVAGMVLWERLFGIACVACGDHAWLPAPSGWVFETCFDGSARWMCPECRRGDADHLF